MKITRFERSNLERVRKAIEAKVAKISKEMEEEYGLSLKLSTSGSFSEKEYTIKLSALLQGVDPLKDDFFTYCEMYGLKKTDFGRTFAYKSSTYKIIGLSSSSRKYPIVCQKPDGKNTMFNARMLGELLG